MSTIGGLSSSFTQTGSTRSGGFSPPSFSSLDGDTSGGISLDELKSALSDGATSKTDARAEALFKSMDTDSDGSVTESEKSDFDTALQDRMSTMQLMAQIAGQDDEESSTSAAQSRPMGPPPGPPPSADDMASTLMDAIDSDSDSSATLDEFTSAVSNAAGSDAFSSEDIKSAFGLLDSDSSGSLTSTEIASFLQSMQPQQRSGFGGPPPADWMQQANGAYASSTSAASSTSYLAAA